MVSSRPCRSGLLAGLAIAGMITGPTALAEEHHAPPRFGVLNLMIHDTTSNETRNALLICGPDSGTHPAPKKACDTLAKSGGDLTAASKLGVCPLIYKPVAATATGVFNGKPVNYSKNFANSCLAADATGGVMDF